MGYEGFNCIFSFDTHVRNCAKRIRGTGAQGYLMRKYEVHIGSELHANFKGKYHDPPLPNA